MKLLKKIYWALRGKCRQCGGEIVHDHGYKYYKCEDCGHKYVDHYFVA